MASLVDDVDPPVSISLPQQPPSDKFQDSPFGMAMWAMEHVDPKIIFWVLLPPLLYEDSSTMNWHVGKRVRTAVFLRKRMMMNELP